MAGNDSDARAMSTAYTMQPPPDSITDDYIISCLSEELPEIREQMIDFDAAPELPRTTRPVHASTGPLSRLPYEVIQFIFDELDFQSLSRLSQASLHMQSLVYSLPAYYELMEHAPKALKALAKTILVTQHSSKQVRDALHSETCASCGEYAPFLFLPTCSRSCWVCLDANRSLWVMPKKDVAACFSLSKKQVEQLTTMRSIPGSYNMWHCVPPITTSTDLVCLGSAMKLALAYHGSEQELARLLQIKSRISAKRRFAFQCYQRAYLDVLDENPFLAWGSGSSIDDPFGGVASIHFPSLASNSLEFGLWCKGCNWPFDNFNRPDYLYLARQVLPDKSNSSTAFCGLRFRGRSRSDFLHHVKRCVGVRQIAEKYNLCQWYQEGGNRT